MMEAKARSSEVKWQGAGSYLILFAVEKCTSILQGITQLRAQTADAEQHVSDWHDLSMFI